ncbi:tripartite motif-containing protein 5-like [Mytilus edulis]|uniref:tripartite motif-containing protein 5-like n=1 Tax=Mytilus edulis TaxID=6550 RepID=UPI0039EF3065
MATSCSTTCSVCEIQHKTKDAEHWCPECEQGLCSECLNYHNALKSSRNHEVIPVEYYKQLPSSISSIQQHCRDHNRKFQIYCPQHESLCCPLCISSSHRNCIGLLSLEEVIATSKTSSLLESMEQRLQDVMTNAEKVISDRKQNLTSIQNQHHKFLSEITQIRDEINKHLDLLEKQSFKELQATEKDISRQIETAITNVTKNYKYVCELKNEMDSIRKYASNLQTFLGAKILEEEIQKKEKYLQSLSDDGSLQQVFISYDINDELSKILSIQKFGSVLTENKSSLVVLETETDKQAQILRQPVAIPRLIHDIKLTLQQTMTIPEKITGCSIHPSGKFIFANFVEHQLIILTKDAKPESVINTSIQYPVDVACIDDLTVAVSFRRAGVIQIINITSQKIEKTINTLISSVGLTYQDHKLSYCEYSKGVIVVNLPNTSTVRLVEDQTMHYWSYITTYMDRLYHTKKNTVSCYSLTGKKIWDFKDESLLKSAWGLTTDKHSFIYVADRQNNSIVVITPDGKKGRRILGKKDGIIDPHSIFINKENDTLLVANYNGTAVLYKLTF